MTDIKFYGPGLPNVDVTHLPGKLIVLEGPDGVGRSTQVALLREWLAAQGYAVFSSGLRRSELLALTIDDLEGPAAARVLAVRHGKGSKFRAVPISPPLERLLAAYLDQRWARFPTPGRPRPDDDDDGDDGWRR